MWVKHKVWNSGIHRFAKRAKWRATLPSLVFYTVKNHITIVFFLNLPKFSDTDWSLVIFVFVCVPYWYNWWIAKNMFFFRSSCFCFTILVIFFCSNNVFKSFEEGMRLWWLALQGCCLGVVATGASLAVLSRLGDDQAGNDPRKIRKIPYWILLAWRTRRDLCNKEIPSLYFAVWTGHREVTMKLLNLRQPVDEVNWNYCEYWL